MWIVNFTDLYFFFLIIFGEGKSFLHPPLTFLFQIVSSGKVTLPLVGMPCNKGELTVVAEELALCRDEVLLQFSGRNLDRKDWFGKYVV